METLRIEIEKEIKLWQSDDRVQPKLISTRLSTVQDYCEEIQCIDELLSDPNNTLVAEEDPTASVTIQGINIVVSFLLSEIKQKLLT